MNKVCTLSEAVEKYVQNGDTICFGGFTTNRKPYAVAYEILRLCIKVSSIGNIKCICYCISWS